MGKTNSKYRERNRHQRLCRAASLEPRMAVQHRVQLFFWTGCRQVSTKKFSAARERMPFSLMLSFFAFQNGLLCSRQQKMFQCGAGR